MIGEEVRSRREALGLTGAQLATRAGLAPSAVSQIETGKRTPSSTSVIKLAAALGVEVGDLYPKGQAPLPDFASEQRREPKTHASGAELKGEGTLEASGRLRPILEKVAAGDISVEEGEEQIRRELAVA